MKVKDAIELLKDINPEYSIVVMTERQVYGLCLTEGFYLRESTVGPVVQLIPSQKVVGVLHE